MTKWKVCLVGLLLGGSARAEVPPVPAATVRTVEEVAAAALPSVVEIRVKRSDGGGMGSGFVLRENGVVVTNHHVLDGALKVAVRLPSGDVYEDVRILGFDKKRDVAVLKIPAVGLTPLSTSELQTLAVGARVVAIGHPSGLDHTVTAGIVSSIRVREDGVKVIQTDAAVSQGNSGGPLLNERADVVGVVAYGIGDVGKKLSFAIPIEYVLGLLEMPSNLSIEEFAAKSNETDEGLFEASGTLAGLSGRWVSLNSATYRNLQQDGDFLVGAVEIPAGVQGTSTLDLKRQADGSYSGVVRWRRNCVYETNPMADYYGRVQQRAFTCEGEDPITLRLVSPSRIEGQVTFRRPKSGGRGDIREFCKSGCTDGAVTEVEDFVWTRVERSR
jgi:hypothetical protein